MNDLIKELIMSAPIPFPHDIKTHGKIRKRSRLGGLLNFYYREAA